MASSCMQPLSRRWIKGSDQSEGRCPRAPPRAPQLRVALVAYDPAAIPMLLVSVRSLWRSPRVGRISMPLVPLAAGRNGNVALLGGLRDPAR